MRNVRKYSFWKANNYPSKSVFNVLKKPFRIRMMKRIVCEAARDLARFAKTPECAEEALAETEALIKQSGSGSKTFHWGNLARARILARLGENDIALAIFRKAVLEQWDENTYREFFETFEENGQYAIMAAEEYYRQTTDDYSDEVRQFHNLGGDLLDVLCHLRALPDQQPG